MKATLAGYILLLCAAVGCGGGEVNVKSEPMPEDGTFTGVWFSPQYGRMDMVQTGNNLVGEYEKDGRKGKIQGTVEGDLARFTWTETRELVSGLPSETTGRGYFKYEVDPSTGEHKIVGQWGMKDKMTGGGPWNAVKSPKLEPELSSGGGTSGGDSGGSDFDSYGDESGTDTSEPSTDPVDDLLNDDGTL